MPAAGLDVAPGPSRSRITTLGAWATLILISILVTVYVTRLATPPAQCDAVEKPAAAAAGAAPETP